MELQKLWIEKDVKEGLPEDLEKFYHVLLADKTPCSCKGKNFGRLGVTSYLIPTTMKARDEKLWDAARSQTTDGITLSTYPTLDDYLQSIIK